MRAAALTLVLVLALAGSAFAQGPSQDGYTAEGPRVLDRTQDDGVPGSPGGPDGGEVGSVDEASDKDAEASSTLPFTGMDLVLVAALGGVLLGVGAGMRRLTQPPDQAH